jgi:hypothetical protein
MKIPQTLERYLKKKFLTDAANLKQHPTDDPNYFYNPEGGATPGLDNNSSHSEPTRGI